ncbi:putative Mannosyltransferase [Phytophthora infestans]|uniref:Putative Mannosyltransferase n=1 Tax=Phytophthora infestans TaxID=4787 RepID=A0A8S9U285_PHYIN|nr:putative Mannosyltransferase [Phytophthora infestans]
MPPPRYAPAVKRYAPTRTPPNSPRNAPRVGVCALFSVIGLYALGFIVWNLSLSSSFVSYSLDSGNDNGVQMSSQSARQLRRRQRASTEKNNDGTAGDRRWMHQLLDAETPPDLRCIGWKQTDSCDLKAKEVPTKNRGCDQFVRGGIGGYCLMKDGDTGQEIRVMHTACDSLHPSVTLSCRHAGDFVDFQWEVAKIAATIEQEKEIATNKEHLSPVSRSKGILMVIYPKLLVSAYASIRALRAVNCTLSVELWYIESEMDIGNGASLLADIPKILQEEYGPLTLRSITDARVAGFNSKVYAITHTEFEHVLFLDADNVPVRDPSYLFSTPEFVKTGAILWPDFWHPANTIFNINEDSLLWELLDMPFTDMYEQESGQLVIDRTKSSAALRMLSLFAFHDPNLFTRYKLVHGDKDLFRLAWLKTKTPFHMIANPPGIAGTVRETKFCGMSMAQFDTDGEVLFLHRNAKKLKGGLGAKRKPDEQIWSHLQLFQYRASSSHASEVGVALEESKPTLPPNEKTLIIPQSVLRQKYSVHFFNGAPEFDQTQWCYGESKLAAPNFKTIAWEDTAFPHVEEKLLMYANEAVALLPTSAVEYIVQSDREEAS